MRIAERIENDLLNLYAGFTVNAPVGTAGTPVTEALIDQAETSLFQAKVPVSEPKYQPNTLSQQFTVDVLYGCAVLRNNFSVQVNSYKSRKNWEQRQFLLAGRTPVPKREKLRPPT